MNTHIHTLAVTEIRQFLENDERSHRLETLLTEHMNSGMLNPSIGIEVLTKLGEINEELGTYFQLIRALNGLETYNDALPKNAQFYLLKVEYIGADGKRRTPNTKYIPSHIVSPMQQMQAAYNECLLNYPQHVGPHGRPGLVVMSGYRSHHYQLALFALTTLREGLDHALASMRLPGENSDHADYTNCAIDFTVIGDRDGNQTDNYGNKLPPEATVEMQWLIHNANEYGFYHSFPPDETDPTVEIGRDGIIPEAWHLKFAGSIEEAKRYNEQLRSKESFIRRIEALGLKSLF